MNGSLDESEDPALEALVGRTLRIPIDANPMVKSVVQAYRTNTHPERLSVSVMPAPFDAAQYAKDPDKYLSVIEPGRVWQSAQPGPGVTPIEVASKRVFSVPQRETTSLKVKATPKAPVTFTSLDLGEFQNRLTSITVAADQDGIAVARFTGTPGTYGDVDILAASPVTSGQLHFVVTVQVPGFNGPGPNVTTR